MFELGRYETVSAASIGSDYTIQAGDTISGLMKKVYNTPDTRASEAAGYYRALWQLNKRAGRFPASRNENVIQIGDSIHLYTAAEIEAERTAPGTSEAVVTYVAPSTPAPAPAPTTTPGMIFGYPIKTVAIVAAAIVAGAIIFWPKGGPATRRA